MSVPAGAGFGAGFGAAELECARHAIAAGLEEDLRHGSDATSLATVPAEAVAQAEFVVRSDGVVCGLEILQLVLGAVPGTAGARVESLVSDGESVTAGQVLARVHAPVRGLLTAERTALNLLCHLSGIATATADWVRRVEGTGCAIRDTRKTLPGLRALQKYAVRCGGGVNHRLGLGDAVLVKDNHVAACGGVLPALEAVRRSCPELPCEVEVDSLEQLDQMLGAGVDLVLLDNFPVWQTQLAVQRRDRISPGTRLESSGGLSPEVAADYARTGVDFLAVGALTHSVTALDIGLDM